MRPAVCLARRWAWRRVWFLLGVPGSLVGDVHPTHKELPVASVAAVPLFLASLSATLVAARLFARRLDQLGRRFGFPEALVGLLTALAADGPEVSSALFALIKGEHRVSVGVLVGSNAFNLAAMIGLSGLLVGSVRVSRDTLLLEGLSSACVMLIGVAVLVGWLGPAVAVSLTACVLIPYVLLVSGASHSLGRLARALDQRPRRSPRRESVPGDPTHHLLGLIVFDVALIVAGSAGMVQAAVTLGDQWGISSAVLGMLILAPLTSVPNAVTAVRLGLAGRGEALVGETFNSNTVNLAAGVVVPSLFVTFAAPSSTAKLQLGWLVGMTCVCLLALAKKHGIRRPEAAAAIALYAGFVAIQLA
jgi:cation:H+ antiporter